MAFRISGTGTTFRRKSLSSGTFTCYNDKCRSRKKGEQTQTYSAREERKWFTLLYIPIAPIGEPTKYVQCKSCREVYPMSHLNL